MKYAGIIFALIVLSHDNISAQTSMQMKLRDAVRMALRRNAEAVAAAKQIDAARGRFWRGVSPPPPELSLEHSFVPDGKGLRSFGERTFELQQSFDFPTTIMLRGKALTNEVETVTADSRLTALAVATEVAIAYFQVLSAEQKLKLAEENLTIMADFARRAEARWRLGEGANLEQFTAKAQHLQAQNSLEDARIDARMARNGLKIALGFTRDEAATPLQLSDSLTMDQGRWTLAQALETASRKNPRLQIMERKLTAASLQRSLAWSSLLPNFQASYLRQSLEGDFSFYGFRFGVSLPLWFLLDTRGQIEESSALLQVAELQLEQERARIHFLVENLFLELTNAERNVRLYRTDLLPQMEEMYRAARTNYEAGEVTYLEFLHAEQASIATRTGYIEALYRYQDAVARFRQAIGEAIDE